MSSVKKISGESDSGVAIAHELDTNASLIDPGAKLWSVKNAGVEVFSVDKDGIFTGGGFVQIVKPSEGAAGIQSAMDAANAAGGGIVQLLEGAYAMSTGIELVDYSNVILRGIGLSTIIEVDSDGSFTAGSAIRMRTSLGVSLKAANNITLGDTSIFTTTAADAGNYLAGHTLIIRGQDLDSIDDMDWVQVKTNGNPGTGEIELVRPLRQTLTSVSIDRGYREGFKNRFENFTLRRTAGSVGITGLQIQDQSHLQIKNVSVEDFDLGSQRSIIVDFSEYTKIQNCQMINSELDGFQGGTNKGLVIEDCLIDRCLSSGSGAIRLFGFHIDCTLRNNIIRNGVGLGIQIRASSGIMRRIIVDNNIIENRDNGAMQLSNVNIHEIMITNNKIRNCGSTGFFTDANQKLIVTGNVVQDPQGTTNIGMSFGGASGAKDVIVSENEIYNYGRECIFPFGTGSETFIISNNKVINNTSGSFPAISLGVLDKSVCVANLSIDVGAGINVNSACLNTIIANNIIENTVGNGITVNNSADGNLVMGNALNGETLSEGTGSNTFVSNI